MDIQLVFTPPKKTDPGYARRLLRATEFKESFDNGSVSPKVIHNLVDFLVDYCSVDGMDRDQVREVIFDLSEEKFEGMIEQILGGKKEVPLVS